MAAGETSIGGTTKFGQPPEAVGFKVIQLLLGSDTLSREELLEERVNANRTAVAKMLSAVDGRASHVFVVSHSESIAAPLSKLLETRGTGVSIGVVGFPERMTEGVLRLRQSGLTVFDIERDAKVFKQVVPRRQLISPGDFDPADYL